MSKDFEGVVLKKLEKLDERTQKTDNVIEEVILKKLEKLDERTKKTDNVIEEVILKKLEKLDALEDTMQNVVLKKLENLESLEESVKNLNNNFTVFDFEINKKIDTLFDAITANNEKHDVFEKSIVSLNTETFNHDIRISVLEDYSKNAKLFATN